MKQRTLTPEPTAVSGLDALADALLAVRGRAEMVALLTDLCTPAELEALCDRWRVVPLLLAGEPYREIHERTAVSVTTVGRVARSLALGSGGYAAAVQRLGLAPTALPHASLHAPPHAGPARASARPGRSAPSPRQADAPRARKTSNKTASSRP